MIPLIPMLMLGGAALGAATSKKPIQGALLGAGLGATGGMAAGGLLGAGAAGAGAAGAGANAAAATQTAGLLAPGAASGAGSQAAMLAAQNQGFGAIGQQLTAQAAGGATGMPVPASVNFAAGMQRAGEDLTKAKPMIDAAGTGVQVASALQPQDQPAPIPQFTPTAGGAESLNSLYQSLQQGWQGQIDKEAEVRKARRRGLLGGGM